MKAIVRTGPGAEFSTIRVKEIPSPKPGKGRLKVRMVAARINPVDMDLMKGMPFLKFPQDQVAGVDGAGVVIDLGDEVNGYQVGDRVFCYRRFNDIGTWAEEMVVNATDVARVPAHLTLREAGACALPLLTAYDCLRQLQPLKGQTILVHGAGGGVGFMAVQVALAMGLEVIATAAEEDVEPLLALGVKQVIQYRTQDFSQMLQPGGVQLVLDVLGKDVLLKSISLRPRKIISLHYIQPEKMAKTGLAIPRILQGLMRMMMRKFRKAAQRNGVELIGQITGSDGDLMQEAGDFAAVHNFQVRIQRTVSLAEVEAKGLGKTDVGNVILFGDEK